MQAGRSDLPRTSLPGRLPSSSSASHHTPSTRPEAQVEEPTACPTREPVGRFAQEESEANGPSVSVPQAVFEVASAGA